MHEISILVSTKAYNVRFASTVVVFSMTETKKYLEMAQEFLKLTKYVNILSFPMEGANSVQTTTTMAKFRKKF